MATLAYSRSILSWLNHPLPFGTKVAKRFEKIWSTKEQKVNSSTLIFQSTVPLSNREIRILTQNAFFTHDQPICSLPSETTQREEILHQTPGCYKFQDTSAIASRAPCSPMRYSILTVAQGQWVCLDIAGWMLQTQVPDKAQRHRAGSSATVLRGCHTQWTFHLSTEALKGNSLTALWGAQTQLHKLWRRQVGSHAERGAPHPSRSGPQCVSSLPVLVRGGARSWKWYMGCTSWFPSVHLDSA